MGRRVTEVPFNYTPFPVHEPFHQTSAREKAAIGAVGSGKTIALCADAILLGLSQPGSRILIARQTVPSLRDTTEYEFLSLLQSIPEDKRETQKHSLYDLSDINRSGGHTDRIVLPNGSEFLFRSLDDWRKLMSLNLAAFYIDEASEIDVESYLGLLTRIRQKFPTEKAQKVHPGRALRIDRHVGAICMNPNGHDWAWEYFVHGPEQLRESGDPVKIETANNRRYFRSTSFDNPTLYTEDGEPGPYLKSLLTMPEVWVRRYVLCEFDAFAGQIYEFGQDTHVHDHFEPPRDWERAMGLDWGLRNPTAIVWWARKPGTTKWFQYREWQSYDPMDQSARESHVTLTVHEVAAIIRSIEKGEKIKYRVADPAIRQRQSDGGKSVDYWFRHYGLVFHFGMKRYEDRIQALNQMFHRREVSVSSACPMTQISVQQYRWSDISTKRDTDAPERPQKKHDHLVNAMEYLATHFMTPTRVPEPKPEYSFAEDVHKTIRKNIMRRARHKPRPPVYT